MSDKLNQENSKAKATCGKKNKKGTGDPFHFLLAPKLENLPKITRRKIYQKQILFLQPELFPFKSICFFYPANYLHLWSDISVMFARVPVMKRLWSGCAEKSQHEGDRSLSRIYTFTFTPYWDLLFKCYK